MFNAVMAMAIALMIVIISIIKNPVLKAVIYSIPIPITLVLVASQNGINSSPHCRPVSFGHVPLAGTLDEKNQYQHIYC